MDARYINHGAADCTVAADRSKLAGKTAIITGGMTPHPTRRMAPVLLWLAPDFENHPMSLPIHT